VQRVAARVLGVFVVAFIVYCASPVRTVTDSVWAVPVAVSLVREHDADVDEFEGLLPVVGEFQTVREPDGHVYGLLPVGASLAALPMTAVALAVPAWRADLDRQLAAGRGSTVDWVVAAFYSAATAALLVLVAAEAGAGPRASVFTGLIFAFATPAWSTTSRALWMHGPLMAAVALALVLVLVARRAAHPGRWYAGAGAAIGFGVLVRPTSAVVAAALVLYVALEDRRRLPAIVLGGAAVGALGAAVNLVLFGALVPAYVGSGSLVLSKTVLIAVPTNLVSPARGLLVYAPVVGLGVAGVVLRRRARTWSRLDLALGLALLGHLLAVSLAPTWWAGWAYGPRFMTDVLPLLMWFVVPVVRAVVDDDPGRGRVAPWVGAALVLAVVWGLFVNYRGATDGATFVWNFKPVNVDEHTDRVWDWSDPPFLR
jgi:hypothetical protein